MFSARPDTELGVADDNDLAVGVDHFADEPERTFEVAVRGSKGVRVDGEGSTEDHERGAVLRTLDGLLDRKSVV